ncbi:MAG TPA: TerB family tellurite resistance protein [Polyangiaceae bacterium]|nr:TerB family tellurite resistance protein [Polyangiaceae bacterium]
MRFQSPRIERLRDRLLRRGTRSVVPGPWSLADASPGVQAAYDRILPYAEVIYLVIAADGRLSEEERDALRGGLRYLTQGELGTQAADAMIAQFESELVRDGLELRLDQVAARVYADPEDRELALTLAMAVAIADGRSEPAEEQAIVGLAERLGFSRRRLQALLEEEA